MLRDRYEAFLADLPRFHTWDNGKTWNTGGFYAPGLRTIRETSDAALEGRTPIIAETGAGNSTILFLLMQPKLLISIAPNPQLRNRIVDYCTKNEIGHEALQFRVARSETVLPKLVSKFQKEGMLLDVAMVDGGHGWPTVFVDFCYFNAMLKKGGLLIVDDLQLYSVNEFARWLSMQREYSLVNDMQKTLIFRKEVATEYLPDFGSQPYIQQRSEMMKETGDPYSFQPD